VTNSREAHAVRHALEEGRPVFLEMFKADRFQDFSFSVWLAHTPSELVMAHLHIDKATLDAIPREAQLITPI
jgi:oxalate decarboxylase